MIFILITLVLIVLGESMFASKGRKGGEESSGKDSPGEDSPGEIINRQYARGEIERAELLRRRALLRLDENASADGKFESTEQNRESKDGGGT